MHTKKGFTVIELLSVSLLLTVIGVLVWTQLNHVELARRDDMRRMAINAMYYNLEEVYYAKNSVYPRTISDKVLTAMDKELFTDPSGVKLGNGSSNYRYEPLNCTNDTCKGYTLRADLEAEADYVKENRKH